MTPANYIDVAIGILTAAKADLTDPATGAFKVQPDFKDDIKFIADVEAAYVAHGGVLSPDVTKVIQGVSAVMAIIGV